MKIDTLLIIAAAGLGLFLLSSSLKSTMVATRPATGTTAASLNNYGALPDVYGGPFAITPYGMATVQDDPYGMRANYQ